MGSLKSNLLLLIVGLLSITVSAQDGSITTLEPTFYFPVESFPDPSVNFTIPTERVYAGDLNADGIPDFYNHVYAFDERTAESDDYIYKTMFWFGGSELRISPDSIMYGLIDPVGDLNNDMIQEYISLDEYGEKTGEIFGTFHLSNGVSFRIQTHESYVENRAYLRNIDLDGDGFSDLISFNHARSSKDTSDVPLVYFGGSNPDSLNLIKLEMQLPDSLKKTSGWQTLRVFDIDGNGSMELISTFVTDKGNFIGIYKIDEQRQFELVQLFQHYYPFKSDNSPSFFATDFDENGLNELNFSSNGYLTTLFLSGDATSPVISDSSRITNPAFEFIPIGDFDKNGEPDYLLADGQSISYIAELNDNGFESNLAEVLIDGVEYSFGISSSLFQQSKYIDLNSDGYNDIVIDFTNYTWENHTAVIFGNPDRTMDSVQIAKSIPVSSMGSVIPFTFTVGDLDGDANADLGFIRSRKTGKTYLEIYLAGQNSFDTPELSIVLTDSSVYKMSRPTIGDFDGDNLEELVMLYVEEHNNLKTLSLLSVEFASDLSNSSVSHFDPSLYFKSYSFTAGEASIIENIGDINHDGADDLALFDRAIADSVLIYTTSDSIFTQTHLSMPTTFNPNQIIGIEDIDMNGTNNFAISVPDEFLTTPEHEYNSSGVVEIYEYDDENNRISNPVFTLKRPTLHADSILTLSFGASITTGDFNGDSITDLAVSPISHYVQNTTHGSDAIFYFYGGESFSNEPSLSFPIANNIASNNADFPGLATQSIFSLSSIAGLNEDESDALLLTSATTPFGIVAHGNLENGISTETAIILTASTGDIPLGDLLPAVGHFNATNGIDIIFTQPENPNYLSSPLYLFEIHQGLVPNEIDNEDIPFTTSLSQNYPNPFNPATSINFELAKSSRVELDVFNILGKKVATIVSQNLSQGTYSYPFNASHLSSGVYIYRLRTDSGILSRKMLLLK